MEDGPPRFDLSADSTRGTPINFRKRRLLVNRDALMNADSTTVARLAVSIFDRIQMHRNYEDQILALAAGFLLLAEATGVNAGEAFTAVKRLMADPLRSEGLKHSFASLKYHIETELMA